MAELGAILLNHGSPPTHGGYRRRDERRIGVAFAACSRRGRLRGPAGKPLKVCHLRNIVEHVGAAIALRGKKDDVGHPFHGIDGTLDKNIRLLLRSYLIADPPTIR